MNTNDFLLELGTEELPPKLLPQLSKALSDNLSTQLSVLNLAYNKVESFATPRRLAVLVRDLQLQQDSQVIERRGPSMSAPEQAIVGFAKSCGVTKADLTQKIFGKTNYYYFSQQQPSLKTINLLPEIVVTAIKKIPIKRPMRWGDLDFNFVRPSRWLVMLLGNEVVNASVMGLESGNITRGLRFTGKTQFCITNASDYRQTVFANAQIEVDFTVRRALIRQQITQVAAKQKSNAVIDEALLSEVCALVEYPYAFFGSFDANFLAMPEEVLISVMKSHQKYFHMVDDNGELLPTFISVANIKSSDLSVIIKGNERVIAPRLSDAEFFWEQDKFATLESRLAKLDSVLFMDGLGSMSDKARRIESLSTYIANLIGANVEHSARAGLLAKTDLVTDMVGEFADLQGVMGGYYALNDGENIAVATAISEHYHPRFSGDDLPSTQEGLVVAIADKVDSIVGIYGIGQKPTGSKDLYALKRAGLGLLRMVIESKLQLDLLGLIVKSAGLYKFDNDIAIEIYHFILERLDAYYQDRGIDKAVVKAVLSVRKNSELKHNSVYDWHLRIQALNVFMQDENSKSLIQANKRIKNILKGSSPAEVDENFTTQYDKNLFDAIVKIAKIVKNNNDYMVVLKEFLQLKPVIDEFFDNVMVNDENPNIRNQRLKLMSEIRNLFLRVADITYLSK